MSSTRSRARMTYRLSAIDTARPLECGRPLVSEGLAVDSDSRVQVATKPEAFGNEPKSTPVLCGAEGPTRHSARLPLAGASVARGCWASFAAVGRGRERRRRFPHPGRRRRRCRQAMPQINWPKSWSRRPSRATSHRRRRDQIGRIWAPVFINGRGPFRLVLDTGATSSGVTAMVALALGIPTDRVAACDAARCHRIGGRCRPFRSIR